MDRIERDPLGEHAVPADAYYGIQTQRAVDNFPISGLRAPEELVIATILVKKAAAAANRAAELLGAPKGTYTKVHPNDHVNMSQSTNDVFPTATRVALLLNHAPLLESARRLQ